MLFSDIIPQRMIQYACGERMMLTAEKIRKQQGDYICRRCINRLYDADLERKDCLYGFFALCRCCKKEANIVTGFTTSGKLKLILK